MNLKQLRTELDDPLFSRTPSGLAFTPGGLRLASRAMEILDLQSRTVLEVSEAGHGRRMLRLASSDVFAEHAAPGLISLFTSRARDLDVELSVHPVSEFANLLASRAVDVALGPAVPQLDDARWCSSPSSPTRSWSSPRRNTRWPRQCGARPARRPDLAPRPRSGAAGRRGLRGAAPAGGPREAATHLPERRRRTGRDPSRGWGWASLSGSRSATTCAAAGSCASTRHTWPTAAPGPPGPSSGSQQPSASAELIRFVATPRATQAMVRGEAAGAGRFRPAVHVTLWS